MTLSIQKEVDLSEANSLRLKSVAAQLVELNSYQDLEEFLGAFTLQSSNSFILGEGSNVILPESFSGVVLRPRMSGIDLAEENENSVLVKVAAGENWHAFVQYTLEHHYYGLENLSLIPGSVGAAPIQNIGAYGVEVCEYIESVDIYDFFKNEKKTLTNKACQFSYRDSVFKQQSGRYLVLAVNFRLSKKEYLNLSYKALKDVIENKMQFDETFELNQMSLSQVVCEIRTEKLPDIKLIANVGSFFKNPLVSARHYQDLKKQFPDMPAFQQAGTSESLRDWKLSAAWLIEYCGWKGKVEGNVAVYEKHALVLITRGPSCQQEVLAFAARIQQDVRNTFAVDLEIEPVLLV